MLGFFFRDMTAAFRAAEIWKKFFLMVLSSGKGQLLGALYVVREVQVGHLLRAVWLLLPRWSHSTHDTLVHSAVFLI